uniref:Uncharacterized protein n=1 Tax=Myoviridae sp. ct31P9 TaxID=2827657 RepID=A0A8S5T313_9CAUD|nr:MAG TPA: hypothetical protein [Myoviridae sp. ct31P9]
MITGHARYAEARYSSATGSVGKTLKPKRYVAVHGAGEYTKR